MESLTGRLLVATPSLKDPNFERTVVLLVAHGRPQGLAKPFEARWIALDELVVEQHDALKLRRDR